jgi:3-hydroxyacyl-CoA dehydrogenase/enoyl-CoA hydratase/3-hydroxybutyryl-CoA epimerase
VIITSAKSTFFAGGDLNDLFAAGPDDAPGISAFADDVKKQLRLLETLGRPVVAAVNGTALGGGLEIALACHYRIALDSPRSRIGLPEATLGLLPGGGGVTRTVRLLGVQTALSEVLLPGRRYTPAAAVELGIVHELADSMDAMMQRARDWIGSHPGARQPWDDPAYRLPGGRLGEGQPHGAVLTLTPLLRKQHRGAPMPAAHSILCAAVEGAQVDFESASAIETRYFAELVCGQVSKNMIQAFFFDLQTIKAGGSRPTGHPTHEAGIVGVIGAGMMGAGIAYSCAASGLSVRLKDVTIEAAERGKAYSVRQAGKAVAKQAISRADADALLARITVTDRVADLADADLIIEAVFEDPALKTKVFQELKLLLAEGALLASNTSTLPITELARAVEHPENFVGLHFFSPVDRMELVEIIAGQATSDATMAKAFDIVQQLRKVPIVVSDSRGFFTSRVVLARLLEAAAMVGEGVPPSSIEQASTQAGYPAGTLALLDELTMTLPLKIREEARLAAEGGGSTLAPHPGEAVLVRMVDEFGRPSRAGGAGFYDYPGGRRGQLWPALAETFPVGGRDVPFDDLMDRLLFVEVVESLRCLDEGVLRSTADANIGSLYGIGFPAWSGGAAQFVVGYPGGVGTFFDRAAELAERYGPRFVPPESAASLVAR